MAGVQFFGKIDRHKVTGKITSEYPAWTFSRPIEDLKESISRKERELEQGTIPPDKIMEVREEIKKEIQRLNDIEDSKPKLTDKQIDETSKIYKGLNVAIAPSLFTHDEIRKKIADPFEENNRNTKPCIKVSKETIELAEANEIKVTDGMMTRNGAERLRKIVGKLLGENTNQEYLRKEKRVTR